MTVGRQDIDHAVVFHKLKNRGNFRLIGGRIKINFKTQVTALGIHCSGFGQRLINNLKTENSADGFEVAYKRQGLHAVAQYILTKA